MITPVNQRWREHRDSYRPAGEVIRTSLYEVAAIPDDTTPKAFVLAHHYAASYPAARFRFGLYRRSELVGVAVFSHPVNDAVLTNVFPCAATDAVELGRFVLLDEVPGNGETWFLARAFDLLRSAGLGGVVSYSDPLQRTTADGSTVFGGHIGTIYQAFNGVFLGRARGGRLHLLPNGTVLNRRTIQKIRAHEKGWRYGVADLVRAGARLPRAGEDLPCWLDEQLPRVTRAVKHPGNLKYAWGLRRSMRRVLPPSLPYPKMAVAA